VQALAELGENIWGKQDPTQVFHRGAPQELVKRGNTYILRLPLPHVELAKVGMLKKADELIVEIGNFKRDVSLPTMLIPLDATVARMVDGALEVTFEPAGAPRSA
jgi:arsenite-transporting ATPase